MARQFLRNVPFAAAFIVASLLFQPTGLKAQTATEMGLTGSSQQQPPPPPTGVNVAFRRSWNEVRWNAATASNVTEFHIFRLENYDPDHTLRTIATVPRNSPIKLGQYLYVDKAIQPHHTYTYFVTAKNQFGQQSNNSNMFKVEVNADRLIP